MQWPPRPGPGLNDMKPNGLVAAASATSHTSMPSRSQSIAISFMNAMLTLRKMFSSSFVSSAASGVETRTSVSTAGAEVAYHDPHVPEFEGMTSSPLEPEAYDCVAIVTNHSTVDYADLVKRGKVIVDFRNATKGHEVDGKVWKL